jgi:AraC family transcriptional regulator
VDAVVASRIPPASDALRAWRARACALLEEGLGSRVDWKALAGKMNLSYHRFRKKFAEVTGATPGRYRAAKVIERAESLLSDPRLSVKRVAFLCGFCDAFHFARRFQAATGLTPAQFQSRWR